ncbi:MAG: hypothetical protein ACLQBK_13725 [Candidatus Sulfotelmatobacter sp.]
MKRIALSSIGIVLLVSGLGLSAGAQNQGSNPASATPASSNQAPSNQASSNPASANSQTSPSSSAAGSSLGDYARTIRKSPAAAEKQKVFDNDNLPTQDKLSIVGAAPENPAGSSSDAAPAAQTNTPPEATQTTALGTNPTRSPEEEEAAKQALWKQWGEKISAQKDQIDLLGRELDVLQREYKIRAAAMYADVGNRMRNSADWDKQDAQYKQQIADKQKALDDAKQKLDDMIEEARKAGVPSSIAEP